MAILIQKDVSIYGGINAGSLYIRLQCTLHADGKNVRVLCKPYFDKNSYLEDQEKNILNLNDIYQSIWFNYDSSVNGTDILKFSHIKIKEYLTSFYVEENNITFVDIDTSIA